MGKLLSMAHLEWTFLRITSEIRIMRAVQNIEPVYNLSMNKKIASQHYCYIRILILSDGEKNN